MQLRTLRIERATYGERKGQYKAELTIDDDNSTITLALSPEATQRIISVAREELIAATHQAATELEQRIASTIPALPSS